MFSPPIVVPLVLIQSGTPCLPFPERRVRHYRVGREGVSIFRDVRSWASLTGDAERGPHVRPEPTTPIVRRGEDGRGVRSGRTRQTCRLPGVKARRQAARARPA